MTPNSTTSRDIREQVINHMAGVAKEATDQGQDGWRAIERAFPGTPTDVIAEAWLRADEGKTEEWWQQVERTIDAEVVKSAVAQIAGGAK